MMRQLPSIPKGLLFPVSKIPYLIIHYILSLFLGSPSCPPGQKLLIKMDWSPTSAALAYFDALRLRGDRRRPSNNLKTKEPGNTEFISALAAGMRAKLMVEVASGASPTTIALATAALHTGGRLVCMLPEPVLAESKKIIQDSGLKDVVQFETGEPSELLPRYKNIEFSVVDCNRDYGTDLLKLLDINPRRSVVVKNNLVRDRKGLGGYVRELADKAANRSLTHSLGEGMEVTVITEHDEVDAIDRGNRSHRKAERRSSMARTTSNNKWLVKVDERSGEEHIFRMPKHHK